MPPILDQIPPLRPGSLQDCSMSGLDIPDSSALQVLTTYSKTVRWTLISREVAKQPAPTATRSPSMTSSLLRSISDFYINASIATWRLVPGYFRIRTYHGLAFIGARLYGSTCSLKVQQLPFGLYLKTSEVTWHQGLANECGALQLVRCHTHIPAPRALDLVSDSGESYLLTSRAPGTRLGSCIDTLSEREVDILVSDLRQCMAELRRIPRLSAPNCAITNALGEACYDHRVNAGLEYDEDRGDFTGPFTDEREFNEILRSPVLPDVQHRAGHGIVFTHSDLNMRNILMQNGRFSTLVDWENPGWYPEYWDFTKAHYITKLRRRWLRIVDRVFNEHGEYEEELRTERRLWEYCF